MTRAYTVAFKQQVVARLNGVNAVSAAQLARKTGISQQNPSRWLSEARSSHLGTCVAGVLCSWRAEQKARVIAHAAGLAGEDLSRYLLGEGIRLADFKRWRLALEEAGEESVSMAKRIGKLERELARKERALAEVTALLVLRERHEKARGENEGNDERDMKSEELDESSAARSASVSLVPHKHAFVEKRLVMDEPGPAAHR